MKMNKLIEKLEQEAVLPKGPEERFMGYGVIGVTFNSGNVLAMRHYPASSVGPGYSSVWHRNQLGMWDFYTDVEPHQSCTRYYGRAVASVSVTPIHINWKGAKSFEVQVESPELAWRVNIRNTAATSFLDFICDLIPQQAWKNKKILEMVEKVATDMLETGAIKLTGTTPNGQQFKAVPRYIRIVDKSEAVFEGNDLGTMAPLPQQAHVGHFCIPQKGLFMVGHAFFEPFNPEIHQLVTHIQTEI